ncbi:hypothetical protein [Bacillus xiapuensis]|uniref:Uncharacterized protein n=1 Tax=Bacillus xiapuensis TaxID=2014075 RepID=A0ABU6N8W5_9BACI|nr:hypothetical protein [Bacillus xiapuensis]
MNTLNLNGLNNTYIKTNRNNKIEIFHDSENNNTIVFDPLDDSVNTESICNGIRPQMYQYLINVLNTENNVTVHWSQVEGTTSDYTIYYELPLEDEELKSHDDAFEVLNNATDDWNSMKYNEVIDGKLIPLK